MKPKVLYKFPEKAGDLFQPSNGTEGMIFCEAFCDRCIHQHPDPDDERQCEILGCTMVYDPNDEEYPREWVFDEEGWPTCTAWQFWDWGDDGDPDDPDNPRKPPLGPSNDPDQINLFPLYPTELDYERKTSTESVERTLGEKKAHCIDSKHILVSQKRS